MYLKHVFLPFLKQNQTTPHSEDAVFSIPMWSLWGFPLFAALDQFGQHDKTMRINKADPEQREKSVWKRKMYK